MNSLSYLMVEVKRIFRSRVTWLVITLTVCAPLAGYSLYQPANIATKASRFIANPVLAAVIGGAVLFALLTLFELDRVHRKGTAVLTDTIVSPLTMNAARLIALLMAATAAGLLMMAVYYPYTYIKMGYLFDPGLYLESYMILLLPSLWTGCLVAAAFYQITRRFELSFLLVVACLLVSRSDYFAEKYMLRWINPSVPLFTDDFSNAMPLRMAAHNRLFWLLVLMGLWLVSVLFIRRYGKGIIGSLARNGRKLYLPMLAVVFFAGGAHTYISQPYINNSLSGEDSFDNYDYYERLFLISTQVNATPDVRSGTLNGTVTYQIRNENTESLEQKLEINSGYTVHNMTLNGQPLAFTDLNIDKESGKQIVFTLPPVEEMELVIEYGGYPKAWAYLVNEMNSSIISREYIDLTFTSFAPVLPMRDADDNDPADLTATFTIPADMVPIVPRGGNIELVSGNEDGTKTWNVLRKDAISMSLLAADFIREDIKTEGLATQFYYGRKHQNIMESSNIRELLEEVIDYCTHKFGPHAAAGSGTLKLVQTTAFKLGGIAAGDMSSMDETAFSEEGMNDPWKGAKGNEVLAHEIIHQWWGLSTMFQPDLENHWTQEGLTVYVTYRFAKEKYGEEYARKNYIDVWEQAVEAQKRNFYTRNPHYLDVLPDRYAEAVRLEQSRVNEYCLMALKILKAEQLVGGEKNFDKLLAEMYETKGTENYPLLSYNDFLKTSGLTKEMLELD
ncbi:hypothetical protein [Paenibacillus donghaensis]|uniref:Peptidase M1 membrane alanine aminopeptidase domain-containing protein n=1 Tax=Paenibacillus donghaensis TaxID=414771 RepID=A0A2Z2KS26_9BACL|nr:hypothetical protein [Paenibacillus donghaensis]ASA25689.1 hypothetical protein B9T62_36145 [Paenibacillus donghaensis]